MSRGYHAHMHTAFFCSWRTSSIPVSFVISDDKLQFQMKLKALFSDSQAEKKHRMTSSDCMASHGLIRPILLHCGLGCLVEPRAQATPVSSAHLSRASHPTVAMCRRELPFLAELTYVCF